jgi:hypothetical protein
VNITEATRRNIIDYLILQEPPFYGNLGLVDFLKRIWDLSSMPSRDIRFKSAEGDIWQHAVNNNDWTLNHLLCSYLNLLKCDDETFLKFVETCLHPIVLDDGDRVSETLIEFNRYLGPDGYKLEVVSHISNKPLYKAIKISPKKENEPGEGAYEVVLSFAGEERDYVQPVAKYLTQKNVKVFYDKFEQATLWGKDLAEHLDKVYRISGRYCVMFISKNYANKMWPTYERRSAFAKAIQGRDEYILPVRFDDTEIPGLRPTIGYIKASEKEPEQLGELILQKLGRLKK